jgi:hypothetical protein
MHMKFMVIVKATEDSEAGVMPTVEEFEGMTTFNEALVAAGVMKAGEGLHPSSNGVRVHFNAEGTTVVDGPFAEVKELIAGFWIWECASLAEATEWARKCPNPMRGESQLEIRQIFTAEDFGDSYTPEIAEREQRMRETTEQK